MNDDTFGPSGEKESARETGRRFLEALAKKGPSLEKVGQVFYRPLKGPTQERDSSNESGPNNPADPDPEIEEPMSGTRLLRKLLAEIRKEFPRDSREAGPAKMDENKATDQAAMG